MDRSQLEHALRAAQEITGEKDFVVIGSCSVLGWNSDAGKVLTRFTEEIDLCPRYHPELSERLNAIGEASNFRTTFGFYVDPVGPETATLPSGWEGRLSKVCNANTNHATGWCVDVNDVAVAKLVPVAQRTGTSWRNCSSINSPPAKSSENGFPPFKSPTARFWTWHTTTWTRHSTMRKLP